MVRYPRDGAAGRTAGIEWSRGGVFGTVMFETAMGAPADESAGFEVGRTAMAPRVEPPPRS